MKKNNIEDLFKDSFEDFEADVNPGVWKNIQTALKGAGLGIFGKLLMNKIGTNTLVAVVSSAATVVATALVMNGSKTEAPKKKEEPKVVAEAAKPSVNEIKDFLKTENDNAVTPAVTEPPVNKEPVKKEKENAEDANSLLINNDKINSVIKEYSGESIADVVASPISGAAPLVVNINNNGTGKINKWSYGDGSKKETGANPVHLYDEPGIYTIVLTSTTDAG